ncbi:MAG: cysteine desulfurase [Candidatus Protochlamydia sp.]|nr:cysteine desulfurase [Candidatus Protochlamydia sp.]
MNRRIYLDANASTFIDQRVLQALIQHLQEEEGNPSSIHAHGRQSRKKIEKSRLIISRYLKVKPNEIFFTSGGTEGAFILLHGFMKRFSNGHLITSNVEHPCIFEAIQNFEKSGYQATYLSPGRHGAVQPDAVKEALRPDTRLITLMAVNNETGVKTDIEAIAEIAWRAQVPLIVDGVALLGKESFQIPVGVSAMFFSGHKIHAPKGIGFCFCRQGLKLIPLYFGGNQEFHRRAGTENIPGIIALAEAVQILEKEQALISGQLRERRDQLEKMLMEELEGILVNGEGSRTVNTSNLSFERVDGESLLLNMDLEGISASHGSACSSGALEASRVLLNMGIPLKQARSAIRFSVGRNTTQEEIFAAVEIIKKIVRRLRS